MPLAIWSRHALMPLSASDTLIYDLQFRLRCSSCRAFRDFEITVKDVRNIGDNAKPCPERVIVPKGS